MKSTASYIAFFVLIAFTFSNCKSYKQNILFKTETSVNTSGLKQAVNNTYRYYHIEPGDNITIEVFTNGGERIIDPDFKLVPEGAQNLKQNRPSLVYTVDAKGFVKLPILGSIPVGKLTLLEVEEILNDAFAKSYHDPYVKVEFANKRVVVLGAQGGQVIPLLNEKMSLLEVLALAGGMGEDGRANNIRLIRGNLEDPEVFLINLSTIEGMLKSNLAVRPGDVIYVEPVKRVLPETFRDYGPLLSAATSILTLIFVIQNVNAK